MAVLKISDSLAKSIEALGDIIRPTGMLAYPETEDLNKDNRNHYPADLDTPLDLGDITL